MINQFVSSFTKDLNVSQRMRVAVYGFMWIFTADLIAWLAVGKS